MAAVVLGWLWLLVAVAGAAAPGSTWVTNGPVLSVLAAGNRVYIGGQFTYVGPNTGSGVRLDLRLRSVVAPFPKVNGSLLAVISDGADGYYVGGSFDRVGGAARANLAHIEANGRVDPSWSPNPNNRVLALAMSGSTVYASGEFTSIGGGARRNLAALDARSGGVSAWNPNPNNRVLALAVSGSTVYAGGDFTSIGGQTRHKIAALDARSGRTGAWSPSANGPSAYVDALVVAGSTVYAGGSFTSIGGRVRHNIAALDAGSGRASAWNPNASGPSAWKRNVNGRYAHVLALALSGSTVYAGGEFTSIGGRARRNLAGLDARSGRASGWSPNAKSRDAYVGALAVSGSTVYAAGSFSSIGGRVRHNIAALDAGSGRARASNANNDGPVNALALSHSRIYAGGYFTSLGGLTRRNIAVLDARSGRARVWNPNANGSVGALALSGSKVYAGGGFTSIGGKARHKLAALDVRSGRATGWNPRADGRYAHVVALAVSGATIYAGGNFSSIGGRVRHNLAALDARSARARAWNPSAGGGGARVVALAVAGSTVYTGGYFPSIGGRRRHNIAALDARTGRVSAWNPRADGGVFALTVSGATIYAGGSFTSIGGQARHSIAALDARSGRASAWNPSANAPVVALAVSGPTIYAGGGFTSIGGQPRHGIAALDVRSGRASAFNPDAAGDFFGEAAFVDSLAVSRSTIYAGGHFLTIGGALNEGLAAFPVSG